AASRRLVVGARPPGHGDPARRDHCGHSIRLGASEARRTGAVADREGDRAGAERAALVVFISQAPETVPPCAGATRATLARWSASPPIASELWRRSETTRRAKSGLMRRSKKRSAIRSTRRRTRAA